MPYLIGLLADGSAPDRTLGHELLTAILPGEELDRLSGAPDGPLPDGASPADLSPQQHAAAHTVAQSGLADHPAVARLLRECNLPSSTPLTA